MKNILLSLLMLTALVSFSSTLCAQESDGAQAARALLGRILPHNGDSAKFELTLETETIAKDFFTISCDGAKVYVSGDNNVNICTGINWFLAHYAGRSISWENKTTTLPSVLPVVASEVHRSKVSKRYYLNFCTHSYTMAFWDWQRWQEEIDWMALHGINMPLVIEGMECVWKDMLQTSYGYQGLEGVNKFVTGPAYFGWFFMDNMTAWGGPLPESWYRQREALAKNIFRRMAELDMSPVIPGYVGMVPSDFLTYADQSKTTAWTAANVVAAGSWNSFKRPYFVADNNRLKEMAAHYYEAVERLYGTELNTHYYAIDPFHEGGVVPSGVDAQAAISTMWQALQEYDSSAIWVAQHWQENPKERVTHTIPLNRLIILDLHGDSQGDTSCSGSATDANGNKHQWVWGMLHNYGGNVGLFGRMEKTITSFYAAARGKATNNLVGIGAIPEGIENNPVLFDMLYALPWRTTNYTLATWIDDYVFMRYGAAKGTTTHDKLVEAWNLLAHGIYNCTAQRQQGTTESVFMMRPNTQPGYVSTWANSSWYWNFDDIKQAAFLFLSVKDELGDNPNFRYDLVDIVRQCLADEGKNQLATYNTCDDKNALGEHFLQMILDQDTLLGTVESLRLGRWIEMARNLGETDAEKTLYEKNARMLVTTWGDAAQCNNGNLHDYGNREWNGLLSSYYYPRWKYFFDATRNGQQLWPANGSWFTHYEWPFVTANRNSMGANDLPSSLAPYNYGSFQAAAQGNAVETAQQMFDKYFPGYTARTWDTVVPTTGSSFTLTNSAKWYHDAGTEGLSVAAPNSDYSAGYRLQRKLLVEGDSTFVWVFEAGSQPGTVHIYNAGIRSNETQNETYGAYLTSNTSSSAYPALTLGKTGSDFLVFQSGEDFYITTPDRDCYFAPDCKWNEACVLRGESLGETSLLRLTSTAAPGFMGKTWELFNPETEVPYILSNVSQWYHEAETEGLSVAAPNSDYTAGYRLQRRLLVEGDDTFNWLFEEGSTSGTYRIYNAAIRNDDVQNETYGAYLTSTSESTAYPALTLGKTGTDFLIFRSGDEYYITTPDRDCYFAPDCKWNEACVLRGESLSETSLLRLTPERAVNIRHTKLLRDEAKSRTYDIMGRPAKEGTRGILIRGGKKFIQK